MSKFINIGYYERQYITPEYLRTVADEIEANIPERRIEALQLANEDTLTPYVAFQMVVHKVMPDVPKDIVGVSPMAPPSDDIFKLRKKDDND